eukprot:TRINITY_DN9453_c0_g6_i5.p1 TRINITY_DN9453_c0_g6~~TRINITY_DN9453_c0_g6_i5.p1  ORF type:complete len:354 (-),score=60.14 TRINITY_DN9453_c0_g6_i5:111-1172(-)
MKQLGEWDPFKLDTTPKYKRFVMIFLYISLTTAIIATLMYGVLELFNGRALSRYKAKAQEWNSRQENLKLANISVQLSVTPSENTVNNVIEMEYRTEGIIKKSAKGAYNYSEAFFFYDRTGYYFPVLDFTEEGIPIGDPQPYCISLAWTSKGHGTGSYEDVEGFKECKNAFNPKVTWRDHASKYGIDIYPIQQSAHELKSCNSREECQHKCNPNGIAKEIDQHYICYSYQILTDICLLIKPTATGWTYAGGCFADSSPTRMASVIPGKRYSFDDVRIQVRSHLDPYVVVAEKNGEEFVVEGAMGVAYTVAFSIMFAGIVCGVIVAAAVLLKEPIVKTQLFARLFKGPPLPPST